MEVKLFVIMDDDDTHDDFEEDAELFRAFLAFLKGVALPLFTDSCRPSFLLSGVLLLALASSSSPLFVGPQPLLLLAKTGLAGLAASIADCLIQMRLPASPTGSANVSISSSKQLPRKFLQRYEATRFLELISRGLLLPLLSFSTENFHRRILKEPLSCFLLSTDCFVLSLSLPLSAYGKLFAIHDRTNDDPLPRFSMPPKRKG
jgi:hypothetical protein